MIPFGESDQAYFQGRSQETEELFRQRLSVPFGLSGLGKSSLLLAGLFPRKDNFFPVYIRLDFNSSNPDLMQQTFSTFLQEASKSAVELATSPGDSFWEYLHRTNSEFWGARNRPVVPIFVFDQFEEIFTLGQDDRLRRQAVETFLNQLADLAEGRAPVRLRWKSIPRKRLTFRSIAIITKSCSLCAKIGGSLFLESALLGFVSLTCI